MSVLSRKIAQGRATREKLIAVARAEFGERGYAETSVDEIVRRAALTKGAFYHHFSGKDDLFLRVFENIKRELGRAAFVIHGDYKPFGDPDSRNIRMDETFHARSNREIWRQLIDRCRRYVELHVDPELRRIVLVDARWVLSWETWQRVEGEHGITLLRADLRIAMRRGIVRPLPLHTLATLLTGVLNEACLLVANRPESEAALDDSMTVIACFLDGLQTDEFRQGSGSFP